MTAKVITVTSGKGGVGKTTATANLAVALAYLGNRVVCVDADIGLRNLDVVMGLENRIVYDLVDVVEGRARLRQAMIKDKRLKDELYMIPAAQTRDKTAVSPSDMIRIADELRTLVDYVLIDSPAGIERGFRNAVAPADEVLIVTNPEVSSVRDADRIIGLIEAEGKGPGKLIINRVKSEMVKKGDMLSPEDIIDILSIDLIGLIPEDEGILVSTNRGKPVAYESEESRAGLAFINIGRRLMGQEVPFVPLEDESTWLQKLLRKVGVGSDDEPKPLPPPPKRSEPKTRKAEEKETAPGPALVAPTKKQERSSITSPALTPKVEKFEEELEATTTDPTTEKAKEKPAPAAPPTPTSAQKMKASPAAIGRNSGQPAEKSKPAAPKSTEAASTTVDESRKTIEFPTTSKKKQTEESATVDEEKAQTSSDKPDATVKQEEKAVGNAPGYTPAAGDPRVCPTCKQYQRTDASNRGYCTRYKFEVKNDYTCDSWAFSGQTTDDDPEEEAEEKKATSGTTS